MQCNGFVQSKAAGELEYDSSPLPRAPGLLKYSRTASLCGTLMGNSLLTSISRKSQGGDPSEKRYQKAFQKINALSMTS
jgi:hypothetical protein